jgi:sugar/nucleoside kinase (ribokinase family)
VDTLGAGDFFHGALAFRIASMGLDDARFADDLAYAARVAGESLASFGTRAWLAGRIPSGA